MVLKNLMFINFLVFIASVSACSPSPDECKILRAKPLPAIIKVSGGYAFQHELNSDILACAEKLGEELRLQVHVRAADRQGKVADQIITRPEIQVLFPRNQQLEIHQRETTLGCMERYESYKIGFGMCGRISAEQVWIKLQGSGVLAHIAATSPRLEPDCPGRKPEPRFKLDGRKRVSLILKPGEETAIIRASTGKKSARCRYERCEIQVRFFVGQTRGEVEQALKPVFTLDGVEESEGFEGQFPADELCKHEPKIVGVEFEGNGDVPFRMKRRWKLSAGCRQGETKP